MKNPFWYLLPLLLVSFAGGPVLAQEDLVVFKGMCDASGAVPLDANRFMVADDEDNVLRVYDAVKGGEAVDTLVLTAEELGIQQLKKIHPKTGKPRFIELDIEAATYMDGKSFWITSHARNSKRKQKSERFQFIGLRRDSAQENWEFIGKPYEGLLSAMIADARFAPYDLAQAAMKGAEELQGLNIEGMTARAQGGVYIGFRNPVPQGRALVVALLNPEKVILGEKPQFLEPLELDLKGLGVRGLTSWRGDYLIAAGGATEQRKAVLYRWSGGSAAPEPLSLPIPADFNPEAFFTPEDRSRFMVLSDDGARERNGVACKKLKDSGQKFFRGMWTSTARNAAFWVFYSTSKKVITMKMHILSSALMAGLLCAAPGLVLASEKLAEKLASATVRLQDAIDAAEQATGGRAYEAKLEKNSFGVEYEVEVLADGQKLEVSVDAQTAKVMGIRKDD